MNKALAHYECDGQMSFTDPASFLNYVQDFQAVQPQEDKLANVSLVLFFDQQRRLKGCNKNAASKIAGPKYGITEENIAITNSIFKMPYYQQKRFLNATAVKM